MVSVKFIIISFILKVVKKIALKLVYLQAQYQLDIYSKNNSDFDLTKLPSLLKKFIIYDKDIVDNRISICKDCEFYNGSRCEKCGCFMTIKTKLYNSYCPVNKWGKVSLDGIKTTS